MLWQTDSPLSFLLSFCYFPHFPSFISLLPRELDLGETDPLQELSINQSFPILVYLPEDRPKASPSCVPSWAIFEAQGEIQSLWPGGWIRGGAGWGECTFMPGSGN